MQALISLFRRLYEWIMRRGHKPQPIPAPGLQCSNYQTQPAGYGPNPVGCAGGTIAVYDSHAQLMTYPGGGGGPRTRIQQEGNPGAPLAHKGLDCGFRTVITPSAPAMSATLELVQYASPPRIEAIDINGAVTWHGTVTAGHGIAQTFQIAPAATPDPIREIVISPPSDETLLLEVCLP